VAEARECKLNPSTSVRFTFPVNAINTSESSGGLSVRYMMAVKYATRGEEDYQLFQKGGFAGAGRTGQSQDERRLGHPHNISQANAAGGRRI